MKTLFRSLLAIVTVTILAACGLGKGKEVATKSVETFHQQFNDSKFTEIYTAATPALKTATNEADFMKFIQAVRRKLGAVKSTSQQGWNVNTFNGVKSVVLTHKTEFEQGSAVETFTFIISGESATLQGYNVNSPALITN
jgi:hypothetical protein